MNNDSSYDLLIVGAGPVGIVIAERAAALYNYNSLIVEKRDHIGGNCYDSIHSNGVLIHNYGPHYFRTEHKEVIEYLSEFTDWIDGEYIVKSQFNGKLYPFPINLQTLELFFGVSNLTKEKAIDLLKSKQIEFSRTSNSEEFVLSRLGRELYEAFYLNYTIKQWDKHPKDLDSSVCGRIPIKYNRDPYYVESSFKKMPKDGYTAMFQRMLKNERIHLKLSADYFQLKSEIVPKIATIYTGPIDRYFEYKYGKLEWRSLEFAFEAIRKEFEQECVQINYPNENEYTRSVEIKHITGQKHPETVVVKEYPKAIGEPYYPIPNRENNERYLKYKAEADHLKKEQAVHFIGRLAEYTYINTDEAVRRALSFVSNIK